MHRRTFLTAVGSLLAVGATTGLGGAALWAAPPASSLLHSFGELPDPSQLQRVFAAGPPAGVLLNSLAPQQLLGWPLQLPMSLESEWLSVHSLHLPYLGRLAGRGSTIGMEKLMALSPQLVVDVGDVNTHYLSTAQQFSEQTQIPYVLVSGRLKDSAVQLRQLAPILGQEKRGEQLAQYVEAVLSQVASQRKVRHNAPTMYLARSADGLETGVGASIHTEVLDLVGVKNVASEVTQERLARVAFEQLLVWDPDIILTQDKGFYTSVTNHPVWRDLRSVKEGRVWFVPSIPFGWMDAPPSINRLLGALWLSAKLDNAIDAEFTQTIQRFFSTFWDARPSLAAIQELIENPVQFAAY